VFLYKCIYFWNPLNEPEVLEPKKTDNMTSFEGDA